MKLASSIRFGGQLVDAANCDYQDYKTLQLLCPACKQPVFLQGDSLRNLKDKTISIPAHFKHFPFVDPALVADCEARVAKYDQKEITKRAAIARNQRLKVFQKYFWQLFINNTEFLKAKVENAFRPWHMEQEINYFLKEDGGIKFHSYSFKNQKEKEIFCNKYINLSILSKYVDNIEISKADIKSAISDGFDTVNENTLEFSEIYSKINWQFHFQILNEIIDFLYTKSSRRLRMACLALGFILLKSTESEWGWFKNRTVAGYSFAQSSQMYFAQALIKVNWGMVLEFPEKYIKFNLEINTSVKKKIAFEREETLEYSLHYEKWAVCLKKENCDWKDKDSIARYKKGNLKECINFLKFVFKHNAMKDFSIKYTEEEIDASIEITINNIFNSCKTQGEWVDEIWAIHPIANEQQKKDKNLVETYHM